ncbi:kinase [Synergistes jonesii]|nr:kinase [Synergistes jonesii]OFB63195.1 kinase [Synergistes jonesii]OFB64067.1 kinase [Synergistes jonesii]OFB67901.1 kinase [Synergistes jonesii]OFB72487.1 kinase [Synergistes jonesii]
MSGAGKSSALNVLEDQGFYAIDNLPPALLPQLFDMLESHSSAADKGVAAVVDVRSEALLNDLSQVVVKLHENGIKTKIIFIDCSDGDLVRRYETTRRRHPLAEGLTILQGIESERVRLQNIIKNADIVIDTTGLKLPDFKKRLLEATGMSAEQPSIIISSFGFKFGAPQDADFIIDARFLPNPNYVDELHSLSGRDKPVINYLQSFPVFDEFLSRANSLFEYVSSVYGDTGKKQLHICVGCTGGRHRSVAVAEMLGACLRSAGRRVRVQHRDIDKGSLR